MASSDHMRIKLGPGAQILEDAPENEELLAEIQNTAPATTSDLFKLSLFYQSYWVQRLLARHLASLALRQLIGLPNVQEALKAAVFANFESPQNEWLDQVEDYWAGYDPKDPEDRDRPRFARSTQTAHWVLYSGIGLLIEKNTRYPAAGEGVSSYYILGNCPNPANMTIEFLTKSNL